MPTNVRRIPEGEPLPDGVCPGCRSARPVGRRTCQACNVAALAEVRAEGGWLPTLPGSLFQFRGGPLGPVSRKTDGGP